jgi:lysosomal alpha-mannosidase
VTGKNLVQLRIMMSNTATNIRIYNDISKGVEIETFIMPLPYNWGSGVEVVLAVNSSLINNNGTFYTDSMGMEMQKRVRNFRPSWNLTVTEPASGNYYPVQSAIYIKDQYSGAIMG